MGPLPMRVEWRFVPMEHMAQCVMTGGMKLMPESSADNWDIMLMVRASPHKGLYSAIPSNL